MPFLVKGTDTSGMISLRRDSAEAALKKARELTEDGCWDVEITGPDGQAQNAAAFEAHYAVTAERAV
ncbi:hypothetical protein [Tardiphaga sp.]|uniref:hypothetical protein n=1 Tax=Tardiphaga sp. TaxID=1926292 RepID=UPI002633FD60|nr:hypothetical protein [Tardiphaga sp.]MDB5617517.1 hypothetical protein [Tardiphaga sp.]